MKRLLTLQKRFAAGTATAEDLQGVKGKDLIQVRKDAGMTRLVVNRGEHGKSKNARAYPWTMSSEQPAGPWGDVVLFGAWNSKGYKERGNPLLWAHDGKQPWIGQTLNLKKASASKTLEGTPTFLPEGMYEFADLIERMVADGFMTNGSVGFNIEDAYSPTDKERKARKMGKYGAVITAANLVEFSIVPVGADSKAVKRGYEAVRTQLSSWVRDGSVDNALAEYALEMLGIYEPLASRSIIVPDFSSVRAYGGGESVMPYLESLRSDVAAPATAPVLDDFTSDLLGIERDADTAAELEPELVSDPAPEPEADSSDDEPGVLESSTEEGEGDPDEEEVVELSEDAEELRGLVEAQEAQIADLTERLDAITESAQAHAQLAERIETRLQETEVRLAAMVDTETRLKHVEGELVSLGALAEAPIFGNAKSSDELANFVSGLIG